jgi:hypothetical protein
MEGKKIGKMIASNEMSRVIDEHMDASLAKILDQDEFNTELDQLRDTLYEFLGEFSARCFKAGMADGIHIWNCHCTERDAAKRPTPDLQR